MINKLRSAIPKGFKRKARFIVSYPAYWIRLRRNYAYDRRRFSKYSSANGSLERRIQMRSWINADYHKIEKALALRAPRPGFGVAVVTRLVETLERYLALYEMDEICAIAINTLHEYREFNSSHGIQDPRLDRKLKEFRRAKGFGSCDLGSGGTVEIDREEILRKSRLDLSDFFGSRHSIRQFSDEKAPRDLIEKAVELAKKTPSVCNRQSWKVYAYDESPLKERVVACQKGNTGFGAQIQTALVVTTNTETFFAVGERNQCWIDGGLFCMSLVYALHSLGLGSICLNWSVEMETDMELHRVGGIPNSEAVIMLIGVGFLPERLKVAQSSRKPLEEILFWGGGSKEH